MGTNVKKKKKQILNPFIGIGTNLSRNKEPFLLIYFNMLIKYFGKLDSFTFGMTMIQKGSVKRNEHLKNRNYRMKNT